LKISDNSSRVTDSTISLYTPRFNLGLNGLFDFQQYFSIGMCLNTFFANNNQLYFCNLLFGCRYAFPDFAVRANACIGLTNVINSAVLDYSRDDGDGTILNSGTSIINNSNNKVPVFGCSATINSIKHNSWQTGFTLNMLYCDLFRFQNYIDTLDITLFEINLRPFISFNLNNGLYFIASVNNIFLNVSSVYASENFMGLNFLAFLDYKHYNYRPCLELSLQKEFSFQ
jgi:hypothetical protein